MSKNKNNDVKFFALLVVGTILTIIGLFLPPIGAISDSLLIIISQLTLLVAALYEVSIVLDFRNKFFCVGKYPKQLKEQAEQQTEEQNETTPKE